MSFGSVTATATNALRGNTEQLARSAQRVATPQSPSYEGDRVSVGSGNAASGNAAQVTSYNARGFSVQAGAQGSGEADLASETVDQQSALRAFQANVAVLKTSDAMVGSLMNQRA